jgi:hypothetical protein
MTDTTTRPAVPLLTIETGDQWTCSCGNTADRDGFYPVTTTDTLAREVEPTEASGWDTITYGCARCGAAYYVTITPGMPGTLAGVYRVFVPFRCVCSYGASGSHSLHCLNYQGRMADAAETRAAAGR